MHAIMSSLAGSTNQTKDGSVVRKCRVADKSASICFSLWNEQAGAIESGDILKLTKGLTMHVCSYIHIDLYNYVCVLDSHACTCESHARYTSTM